LAYPRETGPSDVEEVEQVKKAPVKQPYDFFLVLDIEGTCEEGHTFDYPNEIIEWPICLLGWKDKDQGILEIIDEFRSFVKPTWKPQLTEFCTNLTGITQDKIDAAPTFTQAMESMNKFLISHHLINPDTGERLVPFCWCTDGPWDICNFVVKQCFISKIKLPPWLGTHVIDVRLVVKGLATARSKRHSKIRYTMSIPRQLSFLEISPFQGRQHSGIDDTRNIARIVIELARRGVRLAPNLNVQVTRRWPWMGKSGRVLEDKIPQIRA